jgi:Extensin-like protein C-terminus
VRESACRTFTTVLGPGSDGYHETHVHLDSGKLATKFANGMLTTSNGLKPLSFRHFGIEFVCHGFGELVVVDDMYNESARSTHFMGDACAPISNRQTRHSSSH